MRGPSRAREGTLRTGSTAEAVASSKPSQALARCPEQALCCAGTPNAMTTTANSASVALGLAATKLKEKAHFARAAEKYGKAAVAAAQELAAEDCLIVAYLRARQADCMSYHCAVPTLSDTERDHGRAFASEMLQQCISTLTRRKEAGTLLPGSCRPAEVAWYRALQLRIRHRGESVDVAHVFADVLGEAVGSKTYCLAAYASHDLMIFAKPELQLSLATFLASGLDLLASQPLEPVIVMGELPLTLEFRLASNMHRCLREEVSLCVLDIAAATLLKETWRRVKRSGVLEQRLLGMASRPPESSETLSALLDGVAAEGAARGLRTCALVGCAATEVHAAQFKKCGACRTVCYCSKEHQEADWPSHRAACNAARNAAAPVNDR